MTSQVWRIATTFIVAAVINSMMVFVPVPEVAFAAPLASPLADIDDLPEDGWELVDYLNGDENSDDPNDWPTLFKFCSGDVCVTAECTQPGVRVPELGTEFERNGEYLESGNSGEQNKFHIIDIEEPPPPPPPELASFTVDRFCPTPGQHSDDCTIRVKAFNDEGGAFAGADVLLTFGAGPVTGGKTEGDGVFTYTASNARSMIGTSVTVNVGNLDPQFFDITDEIFEPCTGRCDSLTGSYDRATDSVSLTVKGAQPGWDVVIRNITLGGNAVVCSGKLDANGEFSCTYKPASGEWGLLKFNAQVGGSSGPTCQFEVDTPFPAKLVVHKDCPTHGKDSDDMIFWGEMVDQNGERFTKPITITIKLPNGTQMDVALVNGAFGEITFEDAKDFKGQRVEFFWPQGGTTSFEITGDIFDPCRTPPPEPTPTPTQQPRFGADPLSDLPRPQSAEPMVATVSIPYWGFWVPGVVLTAVVLRKRRR